MPIPVSIITGFLGSGKTTLLNRLLQAPEMARAAVVVNEFGEIGLDHVLIARGGETVVLLENGCLCCSVRGDLVNTLDDLAARQSRGDIPPFDRVMIETSGLADPGPVIQVLLSAPTLNARYRVGAVVATVDAVNGSNTLDRHIESMRQLALADHVLVTKLDLIPARRRAAALEEWRERVRRINPAASVVASSEPMAAPEPLLRTIDAGGPADRGWLRADAFSLAAPHEHHHEGDGDGPHDPARQIHAFAVLRTEPLAFETLRLVLDGLTQNLGPRLLRVKGLVHVADHPGRPAVVQGAQQLMHTLTWLDAWPDDDRRTRLVLITEGSSREEVEELIAVIERMARRGAEARRRST